MKCKKILALFLSAIILFSFSACNRVSPQEVLDTVTTDITQASALNLSTEFDVEIDKFIEEENTDKKTENIKEKTNNIEENSEEDKNIEKDIVTFSIKAKTNVQSKNTLINAEIKHDKNVYDLLEIIYIQNKGLYINVKKIINLLTNEDFVDIFHAIINKGLESETVESENTKKNSNTQDDVTDIYEQYLGMGDIDISAIATVLASLELPEYLYISLDEANDDKDVPSASLTTTVNDYEFLLDLGHCIYSKLVTDKKICTYDSKSGIVSFIVDDIAYEQIAVAIYEFITQSDENLYNVLLKVIPCLPEESVQSIYEKLYVAINNDLLEHEENPTDYISYVKENKKDIKNIPPENKDVFLVVIKNEFKNIFDKIENNLTVSIDTVNKYVINIDVSDKDEELSFNDTNKETYSFKIDILDKKHKISAPKDAENIETLLNGLIAN